MNFAHVVTVRYFLYLSIFWPIWRYREFFIDAIIMKVKRMELFIGNLDPDTTEQQLRTLFKGFDKQATFKIVTLEETEIEEEFVYGLVTIASERLAKKAIKKLNFKKLNDRLILIKEFHYRASQNDKRALNWRMQQWQEKERRARDRRKNRKVTKNLDDYEIVGVADYSRKYS